MPTNINEAVWTSGQVNHTGGGNDALILIPHDIDVVDVAIEVAAATTAQVQVTHDSREDVVGISERPLRYAQVAINDLGATGELRMNAAAGADFTDDGWAVGDTFEVVSHKAPKLGPEGGPPTTIADKQVYTVSSVAALVIGFSEDPAFSLAEGDIVVAQSRAAVAEDSLNWADVGAAVVGVDTAHINLGSAGNAVRVIATAGVAAIDYEFRARHQSVKRPADFVVHENPSPLMGPAPGAEGIELGANAAPVWTEEVVTAGSGNTKHAAMTLAGTDFDVIGVKRYDKINFSGHSQTGNTGGFTVRNVVADKLQFAEPLKGNAGTDDARVRLGHYISSAPAGWLPSDYDELMLQLLGTGDSYYPMQDQKVDSEFLADSGLAAVADMTVTHETGTPNNAAVGPFGSTTAYESSTGNIYEIISDTQAAWGGASTVFSVGGWIRPDFDEEVSYISKNSDTQNTARFEIDILDTTNKIQLDINAAILPDPGAWTTVTAYPKGSRVRPISDSPQALMEAEIGGTAAVGEPSWPSSDGTVTDGADVAGLQEVDVGGAKTGGSATGLVNDATVYTATVDVDDDASPQAIAVTGSDAQTYTTLIAQLDLDTTGATWSIIGGNLVCTSDTTGELSDIDIVNTDLFDTLTNFVAINASVVGVGQITWRRVGNNRTLFHNVKIAGNARSLPNVTGGGDWSFVVVVRDSNGSFIFYEDGVEVSRFDVGTDDTVPGTFGGTPKPGAFTTDYSPLAAANVTLFAMTPSWQNSRGAMSHVFFAEGLELSAAEIQALYDTAVEIGLN